MTNITSTHDAISGRQIIDTAPLGALIRYSDGTPRPPERHKRKLEHWENNNGTGTLVEKMPDNDLVPAGFKLHIGDFVANGVTVLTSFKTFMADGEDLFFIEKIPQPGNVRILDKNPHFTELVHLAEDQISAEQWLAQQKHDHYLLEVVS